MCSVEPCLLPLSRCAQVFEDEVAGQVAASFLVSRGIDISSQNGGEAYEVLSKTISSKRDEHKLSAPESTSSRTHDVSLGDHVIVYWDGPDEWYPGLVQKSNGTHHMVTFDDGDVVWYNLKTTRILKVM